MTIHAPKPESFGGDSGPNRSNNEVTYFTVMRGVNSFPVEQLVNRSDSVFPLTLIADEHFGRRTLLTALPETFTTDDLQARLNARSMTYAGTIGDYLINEIGLIASDQGKDLDQRLREINEALKSRGSGSVDSIEKAVSETPPAAGSLAERVVTAIRNARGVVR
jgi:hypothetical protein